MTKAKNMKTSKKITLSTVKSFIKKNSGSLFINLKSSFDGGIDGLSYSNNGFQNVIKDESHPEHSLGIKGAWFVGQSRDYFTEFTSQDFKGIAVSNSCGYFILAIAN